MAKIPPGELQAAGSVVKRNATMKNENDEQNSKSEGQSPKEIRMAGAPIRPNQSGSNLSRVCEPGVRAVHERSKLRWQYT